MPPELAAAEDLVAAGRLIDAVDRLAAKNRSVRSGAIEMRLRDLRHEAAQKVERGDGRTDWPPSYADPFPELVNCIPEIDSAGLDVDVLGGAVEHHGCLLVRQAFDAGQVEQAVATIERARAAWEAAPEGRFEGDEWYSPLHADRPLQNNIQRNMVVRQGGIWLGDSPAATEQVLADLESAGIIGVVGAHFGERPFFSLQKSTLRRSIPDFRLTAWHQDGSFLPPDVRTINAWVSLSDCGGNFPAPGLEIVPCRVDRVLPVDSVMSPHSISYDLVDEIAVAVPTVRPRFHPGDALLFDERLVHRTHLSEDMTDIRYAIECWFFAPSHHATDYVPLLA